MTLPKDKRRPKVVAKKLSVNARKRRSERHKTIEALRNLILDTRRQSREDLTDLC
jgi:hypothetical protein